MQIKIHDEDSMPKRFIDKFDNIGDLAYRQFVHDITQGMADRFLNIDADTNNSTHGRRLWLEFYRIPFVTSGDSPFPAISGERLVLPSAGCVIESPWATLAVQGGHDASFRGRFIWNERQVLQNKAFETGLTTQSTAPLEPISRTPFQAFARQYSEQYFIKNEVGIADHSLASPIPADLFWLFTQSAQSTRGPFEGFVANAMRQIAEAEVNRYSEAILSLADFCEFNSQREVQKRYSVNTLQEIPKLMMPMP